MLDREGYRPNVGIILVNGRNEVFWGKRIREHAWQFPQGGIKYGESPVQAMYRELHEEVGLKPSMSVFWGVHAIGYVITCPITSSGVSGVATIKDKNRFGSCCAW